MEENVIRLEVFGYLTNDLVDTAVVCAIGQIVVVN